MREAFLSFISDISNLLTPEMALAGGLPMPPAPTCKPDLHIAKGGGKSSPPPQVPTPPTIVIPPAPTPPPPPPPPTASSADVAAAQQQGAVNAQKGFGYKASLLKSGDPATNSATGSGSLLGK